MYEPRLNVFTKGLPYKRIRVFTPISVNTFLRLHNNDNDYDDASVCGIITCLLLCRLPSLDCHLIIHLNEFPMDILQYGSHLKCGCSNIIELYLPHLLSYYIFVIKFTRHISFSLYTSVWRQLQLADTPITYNIIITF